MICTGQRKVTTRNWIELNENGRAVKRKTLMSCRKG